MNMIKITKQRDRLTLTIPQYMLGLLVLCWLDGRYIPEARKLDKALRNDDRDTAREILDRYGYEIDFYEEDDEH